MARKKPKDVEPAGGVVVLDAKEMAEREEAARAYSEEDAKHFVDFLNECVRVSVNSMQDIRIIQEECWRVYCEEEPYNYATKELWQSRIIYPKPFKLVQAGSAIIRKVFEMEFLSVEKKGEDKAADFWRDLLFTLLGRNYANFPVSFADATTMALAIGQSMEMIPYWIPNQGLRYSLIEPGKIHRDPNALSRQPQSGEWWIHQEYVGLHHLQEMEKRKRYTNVKNIKPSAYGKSTDPNVTQEEIARRKNMLLARSNYHHDILTYEFWGTVLDSKGELLLPSATFTVAADHVISEPQATPYPSLRWPGVGYSALPHLNRWDGRGLIQGIRSLWYLMCNLMSLHADHLNWIVNPMIEIEVFSLLEQDNTDIYPGKVYRTHGTVQGHQALRTVDFRSEVGDIMSILNFFDQRHQDGGMLDYHTMGLPGYRAEVTKGEAAQNLDQSMILVGAMAKNVEDGALDSIMAAAETIQAFMTYDELAAIMGRSVADEYRVEVSEEYPTGLKLPEIRSGTFHVSGISGVMKDQEVLRHLVELRDIFENPLFAAYMEPYSYLKAIEKRTYLRDENLLVSEDKAKEIAAVQQAQQDAAIEKLRETEAATAAEKQALVDKQAALAEKAKGEALAHTARADLFSAKAGSIAGGEMVPGEGEVPEEGAIQ